MRRIVILIAAVVLLVPALPAAAGKPVVTDYAEFTWGDGNYIRYDDGVVEVSFTETSYVDCAGATLIQTVNLSGTTTGTLEMKNHMRDGTISFEIGDLDLLTAGGCDLSRVSSDLDAADFQFVAGSIDRVRGAGSKLIERSGLVQLSGLVTVVAAATVSRARS